MSIIMRFDNGTSTTSWAIAQMYLAKGINFCFVRRNKARFVHKININHDLINRIRLIKGYCPECSSKLSGNYCEFCHNPNN